MIPETPIGDIPHGLDSRLGAFLRSIKTYLTTIQASKLPVYTTEQLNAETARLHSGKLVRCSNGDAGDECLAYCDGFNWKVVQLGSNISST